MVTAAQQLLRTAITKNLVPMFYQDGTYRAVTPGVYDLATRVVAGPTVVETTIKVREESFSREELLSDVVLPGDKKLIVQQDEYASEPRINDEIATGGETYQIVGRAITQAPGIVWACHGRVKGS